MNRIEIETKLHRDRAWLLDAYAGLSEEQLNTGITPSEHDPSNLWTALDHLAHLSLIERNFAAMIRRHVSGEDNPVGLLDDPAGKPRSRAEIMGRVHAMTEDWQQKHHGKSLGQVAALGSASRAVTLELLAELSDQQLAGTLPGAPWADGTVGGVLATNADHGRQHWQWVVAGFEAQGLPKP